MAVKTLRTLLRRQSKPHLSDQKGALITVALFSLPEEFWKKVWPSVANASRSQVAKLFLEHAFDLTRPELKVFERLTDTQIGDVYLLLAKVFPPSSDPQDKLGEVNDVTGRHQMRDLRQGMLNLLTTRATELSLRELQRLIKLAHPRQRHLLQWHYMEAVKGRLRKMWTEGVPSIGEVLAMARSHAARRVEDEESLREAILSSLERLQLELQTDGLPTVRELWNEPARPMPPTPKREEALSDLVRRWLKRDLPAKTGIIVNCEVKVERFGKGKLDIKIEAISQHGVTFRRIALIVEVKRCNHRDVATACKTQLVNGYLKRQGLTHGIYLVGWFGSKQGPAKKWTACEQASSCVSEWATVASEPGLTVRGFVLDCRLPNLPAPSLRNQCLRSDGCRRPKRTSRSRTTAFAGGSR
jgi:hypothetical protein